MVFVIRLLKQWGTKPCGVITLTLIESAKYNLRQAQVYILMRYIVPCVLNRPEIYGNISLTANTGSYTKRTSVNVKKMNNIKGRFTQTTDLPKGGIWVEFPFKCSNEAQFMNMLILFGSL